MTRKRLVAVKLAAGAPASGWQPEHVEKLVWLEDGKQFAQEQPRELVARAVNSGEPFYVRTADGTDAPVRARLRHGTYQLTAAVDPAAPDPLLSLPVHRR